MKKIFLILITLLAVSYMACDSNKDSFVENLIVEKTKGPVIISYNADSINCVTVGGTCRAHIVITVDLDKSSIISDNQESVIAYNTLRLFSENHEGGELIDFPEIYYDAKMTGIGVGIYIPEQKAKYIKETNQYILKFLYR